MLASLQCLMMTIQQMISKMTALKILRSPLYRSHRSPVKSGMLLTSQNRRQKIERQGEVTDGSNHLPIGIVVLALL